MHLRNPWIVALWSAIFPGMGHLLLAKYISGFILFVWEVFINFESRLNLAIFYTFIGRPDISKKVLEIRWLLLYVPMYLFAVWDSYRTAVDMNNHFVLAAREDTNVKPFIVSPLGFNYLDRSSPWVAVLWSMISPGTGQLAIHRIMVSFFIIPWWIVVSYYSKILPAIHYSAYFKFDLAKEVADKQWILNIPSLFFFGIYDAYTNTVESNKLYEWELAKFLSHEYQNQNFIMPFDSMNRGGNMYVVSNFGYSINIEKAVTALQMKGVLKENIFAVPLDKRNEDRRLFDTIHFSDSLSTLDIPIILAALFSLFGIIYGFILSWGPIIWALIGNAFGFGLGIVIKYLFAKDRKKKNPGKTGEVVLIISCSNNQLEMIKNLLWEHGAMGVSKISLG